MTKNTLYQDVQRPRALIIDDDQFSQVHITNRILERYDIGLIVVYTVPEAIEILKSIKIDYCLLDHRFPMQETGGLDIVKYISTMEKRPHTYVVTVVEQEKILDEYHRYKIDGIIAKVHLAEELPKIFPDNFFKSKSKNAKGYK